MPKRLLVTMPHCSGKVPFWIKADMLKTGENREELDRRLFKEGDPYTDEIFYHPNARIVSASVSRFVTDFNRGRHEGGDNGVVKRTDFAGKPFYPDDLLITDDDIENRLRRYYDPFHNEIEHALADPDIVFFIDGHSMEDEPTAIGGTDEKRPGMCIANLGDREGEKLDGHVSCDPALARKIAEMAEEIFGDVIDDSYHIKVGLNIPFAGGYVVERYTEPDFPHRKQGIMIEFNRRLYLNEETLEPIPGMVEKLNERFVKLADRILTLI